MGLDICACTYRVKMSGQSPLNVAEWEMVLGKMLRYHDNISKEIGTMVIQIKTEMKSELVPVAEERANYGKVVKAAIRSMWALEYEIEDIQKDFIKMVGGIDITNLTDFHKNLGKIIHDIYLTGHNLFKDMPQGDHKKRAK